MEGEEKEKRASFEPAVLLAIARLCSEGREGMFRAACLRRCNVRETHALMTAEEHRVANSPVGAELEAP